MKTGICSHCKEHCEVEFTGGVADMYMGTPKSNCCGAPLIDEAAPEVDEVETHSGKMPYKGAR